jgi:cytochrome P450
MYSKIFFRATFSPVFTSGKLRQMTPLLQAISRKMHGHVLNLAESNKPFETKELGGKFSIDAIASCAFGVETGSFGNTESEFLRHSRELFIFDKFTFPKILLSQMTPNVIKRAAASLNLVNMFRWPFANEHSKFLMDVVDTSFQRRKESKTKRSDLLDMMIEAVEGILDSSDDNNIHASDQFEKDAKITGHIKKKNLSYDDIIATAIALLSAGYETTGRALSFILYDLAMNQECQEILYEELAESGQDDSELSYETLQTLPYLDGIIHESLRLHPPFALHERICTKDYAVENSNIIIKKGELVRLNVIGICLDPEIYPNPLEYNPERFLKENSADLNPYAFLAFSLGPRNCIGMRFSMYEMKCCISNLVAKFRFLPCEKTTKYENLKYVKHDFMGKVDGGLWIKCERR